jgi:molecular chaperone GrpE (heat shock protein)
MKLGRRIFLLFRRLQVDTGLAVSTGRISDAQVQRKEVKFMTLVEIQEEQKKLQREKLKILIEQKSEKIQRLQAEVDNLKKKLERV